MKRRRGEDKETEAVPVDMNQRDTRVLCQKCKNAMVDTVFVPCGHSLVCGKCSAVHVGKPCLRCQRFVVNVLACMIA